MTKRRNIVKSCTTKMCRTWPGQNELCTWPTSQNAEFGIFL